MLPTPPPQLSSRRAELTSFDRAYVIAVRLREATGIDQFIIRPGNPLQPIQVSTRQPANDTAMLALVA